MTLNNYTIEATFGSRERERGRGASHETRNWSKRDVLFFVIPAQAGIQRNHALDTRSRIKYGTSFAGMTVG